MPAPGEVWSRGMPAPGGGGGGSGPRGVPGGDPPMATTAGGTHPTGMHSCSFFVFKRAYSLSAF